MDNVYNILKKAIGTGFYKVLARAFTISLKLGFISHVWKIAVLCMLIKPDKPPSQTTSYRPISLLSAIVKLFERVIEKRLRKHLEDNDSTLSRSGLFPLQGFDSAVFSLTSMQILGSWFNPLEANWRHATSKHNKFEVNRLNGIYHIPTSI